MSFEEIFERLCGGVPYPYQRRFHECKAELRICEVPTGLGKTATVVADWYASNETTRLVICLPGRALTRQVAEVARKLAPEVKVVELMGGSEDLYDNLRPDERAIIVGTQDVLVSRALNRGYARTPFRWPMDFGLLNNDVTWVFDEVQLLGEVVATSAQLAAFAKQLGTFGNTKYVWMTATLNKDWLRTADFTETPEVIRLEADDLEDERVRLRANASKAVHEAIGCDTPAGCAQFVSQHHNNGELTLVIANTVIRAQEIWRELDKLGIEASLLHSRFRPHEREQKNGEIVKAQSGVVVATQVIEAGVDMNADLMITDAAPWASMVQRFGRVNRNGEKAHAQIYWVRNPQRGKTVKLDGSQFLPYAADEVAEAISVLEKLDSAAPNDLAGKVELHAPYTYVLRRADLEDLFDTTPDLAGNHLDVSRFVRSGDETNVYVAWRSWEKEKEPSPLRFMRDELALYRFFRARASSAIG